MAHCEVNFNVLPGETILYCPYYANHYFRESRAHYHLGNCRRQYEIQKKNLGEPMDVFVCPYFYKHHIKALDWEEHQKKCEEIANREVASIMEGVSSTPTSSTSPDETSVFTVPGTGEIVYANSLRNVEAQGSTKNWAFGRENSMKPKAVARIPRVIGLSQLTNAGSSTKTAQTSDTQGTFSYLENLQKMKTQTQPIGLTKSEKKKWQQEHMEKVRKQIEEDKAREAFARVPPQNSDGF